MPNNKLTIVINGRGGVGKDTLCDCVATFFKVRNVSSITPIKEIARMHGWNGEKDLRSRKFLSDLKQVFTDYCDLPHRYLLEQHAEFMACDEQILFVHIRESEQIAAFVKLMGDAPVLTLLIRRHDGHATDHYGNISDDEVESYPYDYYYDNDLSLEETPEAFASLLRRMAEEHQISL